MDNEVNAVTMILSPCLDTLDAPTNRSRVKAFKSALILLKIPYKTVLGSYKGVMETSFMLDYDKDFMNHVFMEYGQESVLVMDSLDNGFLQYATGNEKMPIGVKTVITYTEAMINENWSCLCGSNEYFTFKA